MKTSRMSCGQGGFTYLVLIFAIVILGIALAASGTLWSATTRHQQELQFRWVGEQYRRAIASYYYASPGSVRVYPPNLSELLEDKRYLVVRRHLRELYPDPFTGSADWRPVAAPDGGIAGVAASPGVGTPDEAFIFVPLNSIPLREAF